MLHRSLVLGLSVAVNAGDMQILIHNGTQGRILVASDIPISRIRRSRRSRPSELALLEQVREIFYRRIQDVLKIRVYL